MGNVSARQSVGTCSSGSEIGSDVKSGLNHQHIRVDCGNDASGQLEVAAGKTKVDTGHTMTETHVQKTEPLHHGQRTGLKRKRSIKEEESIVKMKRDKDKTSPHQNTWDDYYKLPPFPCGGKQTSKLRRRVVSVDDKMVYCGPFSDRQCNLLSFKVHVLCNIVKDPHSPEFHFSGNVLRFPLFNSEKLAKRDNGEVYEAIKATKLASQSKALLGSQPASILEHCLLRYILDIGDTGLSHMVHDNETNKFINWHMERAWGKGSKYSKHGLVWFFDNRLPSQNSLLMMRCMVLKHKAKLCNFLNELDMAAIEVAAKRYGIHENFVIDMQACVKQVHHALSNFDIKDVLLFKQPVAV